MCLDSSSTIYLKHMKMQGITFLLSGRSKCVRGRLPQDSLRQGQARNF